MRARVAGWSDHLHSVHDHVVNARRILMRLCIGRGRCDRLRVEDDEIGEVVLANESTLRNTKLRGRKYVVSPIVDVNDAQTPGDCCAAMISSSESCTCSGIRSRPYETELARMAAHA